MTLVAAYPLRGIPVLIGDFLLTDDQKHKTHSYIPTKPELQKVKPQEGQRRVHGFKKKLHVINEKLVIGFTGDIAPGNILLNGLYKEFGKNNSPTKNEIEKFLADFIFKFKTKTQLVGWIWEDNRSTPMCFNWRGSNPKKIHLDKTVFAGSGKDHFKDTIRKKDAKGMSAEIKTALDEAIYASITQTGKILVSEIYTGDTIKHAYGFGAELIFWDGAKFFYIEKVCYSFWEILVNEDNSLSIGFANRSAIYQNCGNYSLVQVMQMETKGTGALETILCDLNLIPPINDDPTDFNKVKLDRLSFDTPFWFSSFKLKNPKTNVGWDFAMTSQCSEDINSFLYHKDGKLHLDLKLLGDILIAAKPPVPIFNQL